MEMLNRRVKVEKSIMLLIRLRGLLNSCVGIASGTRLIEYENLYRGLCEIGLMYTYEVNFRTYDSPQCFRHLRYGTDEPLSLSIGRHGSRYWNLTAPHGN
jgi:hypothetical protein